MERFTIKRLLNVYFAILIGLVVFLSVALPFRTIGQSQLLQTDLEVSDKVIPSLLNLEPPEIDINKWTLLVDGLVQNPLNLTYDELKALPAVTIFTELICYPTAFVTDGQWTGVQLSYLLNLAEVKDDAIDMVFYAADDYSSSFPVSKIQKRPDLLLAYEKDGEPLIDGFPAMVVAPGQGGYKWVQYVTHIELVDYDHKGYWEQAGYPDDAALPDYTVTVPVPILSTKPGEQNVITSVPEIEIMNNAILIITGLFILGYLRRTFGR